MSGVSGGHLEVPVVYYDLRRQEGLFQVFDSLETLNGVVEEVFNRINTRVRLFLKCCCVMLLSLIDWMMVWREKKKNCTKHLFLFFKNEKKNLPKINVNCIYV